MDKASDWRGVPWLLLGGSRAAKFVRIFTLVFLLLMLASLYGEYVPTHLKMPGGRGKEEGREGRDTPSNQHVLATGLESKTATPTHAEQIVLDAAGNSTLGFGSIQLINLPGRFDRTDAVTLQAYLSGIDITEVSGVESKDINPVGMPPEHTSRLKKGEQGCWRAHANIWSQMLRDTTPVVLILESDAAWDINVRAIVSNLNQHFTYLLHKLNSTALPDPSFHSRQQQQQQQQQPEEPEEHPLGPPLPRACHESALHHEASLRYPDPHVPASGRDYYGEHLGAERVVRRSGGLVCTTAYAVSRTGAAKLLVRGAVDLDNPVDLLMRQMIASGDLLAYSVQPTVFAQWEYVDRIGMAERGANSDINGYTGGGGDEDDGAAAGPDLSGWDEVRKTGSVWRDKQGHEDIAFENMALMKAWGLILGDATLEMG